MICVVISTCWFYYYSCCTFVAVGGLFLRSCNHDLYDILEFDRVELRFGAHLAVHMGFLLLDLYGELVFGEYHC